MACSEGQCFIGKTFPRRAVPRGLPGVPGVVTRRGLPLGPSAVADDAVVIPEAPADVSPAGEACDACGPSCRACDPCREKYGHADASTAPAAGTAAEVYTVAMRPAGAVVVAQARPRTWAELSPQERYALGERALDNLVDASLYARPAGFLTAPPAARELGYNDMSWSALSDSARATILAGAAARSDALPEWAREAGISQTTWTGMNAQAREAARQQHVAQSNQGWQIANGVITAASQITSSILNGNLQRDLANINATAQTNAAAAQQAAAEFTARTNLQIAQMQLAAQQAAQAGNAGQAQQFQQAIAAMQAAQAEAQGRQESNLAAILATMQQNQQRLSTEGMSTTAKVGIGAAAFAALLGGAYLVTRKRG